MKTKKLLPFLLLAVFAMGFASCSSDDDEDEKENKFTYGSVNSKITSIVYDSYPYEYYHVFYLYFVGEGLSINWNGEKDSSGKGYAHELVLISLDETLEGDYVYRSVSSSPAQTKSVEFTSNLFVNFNLYHLDYTQKDEEESDFIARFNNSDTNISIKKDGDKYEFTIKGKSNADDTDSKAIDLYYKGTIQKVDLRR